MRTMTHLDSATLYAIHDQATRTDVQVHVRIMQLHVGPLICFFINSMPGQPPYKSPVFFPHLLSIQPDQNTGQMMAHFVPVFPFAPRFDNGWVHVPEINPAMILVEYEPGPEISDGYIHYINEAIKQAAVEKSGIILGTDSALNAARRIDAINKKGRRQ